MTDSSRANLVGRRVARACVALGVFLVLGFAGASMSGARPVHLNAYQRVAAAEVVFAGKVTAVAADTWSVDVQRVQKGVLPQKSVTVPRPQRTIELGSLELAVGDTALFYGSNRNGEFVPLPGPNGVEKIRADEVDGAAALVRSLQTLAAGDATVPRRTSVLASMLKSSDPGQVRAALDYIYLNAHAAGFNAGDLRKPVERQLTSQDPELVVKGTQALCRIGDKASVSLLIDLVGSSQPHVSDNALRCVQQLTGHDTPLATGAGRSDRLRVAQELRTWWNENRDSVHLKY